MAFALLFRVMSGGQSGPARRSGVPLEQPPYQQVPATRLQGELKNTPCPAMYTCHVGRPTRDVPHVPTCHVRCDGRDMMAP